MNKERVDIVITRSLIRKYQDHLLMNGGSFDLSGFVEWLDRALAEHHHQRRRVVKNDLIGETLGWKKIVMGYAIAFLLVYLIVILRSQ